MADYCPHRKVVPPTSSLSCCSLPLTCCRSLPPFRINAEPALAVTVVAPEPHSCTHTHSNTSPGARPRRRTFYQQTQPRAQCLLFPPPPPGAAVDDGGHSVPRGPSTAGLAVGASETHSHNPPPPPSLFFPLPLTDGSSRHSNNKRIHHPSSESGFLGTRTERAEFSRAGHRPT